MSLVDEAMRDLGAATPEEIQRAHDVLCAMLRGELPCPLMAENVRLLHAVHDTLSWVLGGECGEHFRLTMNGMLGVLRSADVEVWRNHPQG